MCVFSGAEDKYEGEMEREIDSAHKIIAIIVIMIIIHLYKERHVFPDVCIRVFHTERFCCLIINIIVLPC